MRAAEIDGAGARELTADARCINPGSKKPQANNKQSISAAAGFPAQNRQGRVLADCGCGLPAGLHAADERPVVERVPYGHSAWVLPTCPG